MPQRHPFTIASLISMLCAMTCGCCSSRPSFYSHEVELTDLNRAYVALADKAAEKSLRDWDASETRRQNTNGKSAWPYTVEDYRRSIHVGTDREFSRTPCGGEWRPVLTVFYTLEHWDHYPGISIPLGGMSHFTVTVYLDTNQIEVEGGA